MNSAAATWVTIGLLAGIAVACGGGEPAGDASRTRMAEALLAADLEQYRRQLADQDYAGAAATGRGIVTVHPVSPQAAEVERTLGEVETQAQGAAESRRLAELWAYQSGTESGGAQSAASIFASAPEAGAPPARLVLRRHSAWGDSAYLYGGGTGFSCPAPCTLTLRFDGAPDESWKATQPATGEPALFIDDHTKLVERIEAAGRLEIDAVAAEGGRTTMVFEVSGFDPAKWEALPSR